MRLTAEMLRRIESGKTGLTDPCVICGGALVVQDWDHRTNVTSYREGHKPSQSCGHTVGETMGVIDQAKRLTKEQRAELLAE